MPLPNLIAKLKRKLKRTGKPVLVRSRDGNVVKPPGEIIREIFSDGEVGIAEARVKEAKLHLHKKMNEYYYVIEGKGKVQLGDKIVELKEGDFLHIPPGTPHKAFSDGKFRILVITRKPWSPKDHHVLE